MKYGFIGCGNMGGVLARCAAKAVDPGEIALCSASGETALRLAGELGASGAAAEEIASGCAFIVLGVKPGTVPKVLEQISPVLAKRGGGFTIVSMAAGVSIRGIKDAAGDWPVIRMMPNTPSGVGEGIIAYSVSPEVDKETEEEFLRVFSGAGVLDRVDEGLMDAVSAISGCAPAFVYMFIEALADGAVECGMPRAKALMYAGQTVLGSAAMVLRSGRHPEALKDEVCSPGGATIAGVHALEEAGFRGASMEAVCAAFRRVRQLG